MQTLQRNIVEELYLQMAEKIRKDLVVTFKRKGVKVRGINIDLSPENVNVRICLNKK